MNRSEPSAHSPARIAAPAAPPILPHAAGSPTARDTGLEEYQTVADTVGLVPSLRLKDNVFQALFIAVFTALAIAIGLLTGGFGGALFGLVGGLIAGVILSGIVLMVMGWMRAIKRMRSRVR